MSDERHGGVFLPPDLPAASYPSLRLRPVTAGDLDQLLAIEASCFGSERFHRRQLRYLLSRPSVAGTVIEAGGRIVAYILLLLRAATANARLYTLAVLPEMRGRGLARRLIGDAERIAVKRGKSRLTLELRADNNAARTLYASLGFGSGKLLPDYYPDGDAALRLVKQIA